MSDPRRWLNVADSAPRRELFGLSPAQAVALLATDWGRTGVLTLEPEVPFDVVSGASLFRDVHALLGGIGERGSVALRPAGWLDPGLVDWLMDHNSWLAEGADEWRREEPATINEEQLVPVQVVRGIAQALGLIEAGAGKVLLTARGRDWVRPERAGKLYARLFQWVLSRDDLNHRMNRAFALVSGGRLDLHQLAAFALWGLGRMPSGWWPTKQFAFALVPPWALEEWLQETGEWYLASLVELSVFPAFRELGLMAEREYPDADEIPVGEEDSDTSRTRLYEAVIRWHFDPEPPDPTLLGLRMVH